MPNKSEWLRAQATSPAVGVDRQANVLRGYVVAQEGPFKSFDRGEFSLQSLQDIVRLGNAKDHGLKVRLGHPSMSDDSTSQFLGRAKNLRMDKAKDERTNKTVSAVRADLYFDKTALEQPIEGGKPKGIYIMERAENDPSSLSSSLVLEADEEFRLEKDGTRSKDKNGDPLPPLWIPKRIHSSDIVDTGDAVDGLLSAPELAQALSVGLTPELQKLFRFDRVARLGSQLLDGMFPRMPREQVDAKCAAFLQRYLDGRYGEKPVRPRLAERKDRLEAMRKAIEGVA